VSLQYRPPDAPNKPIENIRARASGWAGAKLPSAAVRTAIRVNQT